MEIIILTAAAASIAFFVNLLNESFKDEARPIPCESGECKLRKLESELRQDRGRPF